MTHSDQRREATHTHTHKLQCDLSGMQTWKCTELQPLNVTVFFFSLSPSAERSRADTNCWLNCRQSAEEWARQGKSRREEEEEAMQQRPSMHTFTTSQPERELVQPPQLMETPSPQSCRQSRPVSIWMRYLSAPQLSARWHHVQHLSSSILSRWQIRRTDRRFHDTDQQQCSAVDNHTLKLKGHKNHILWLSSHSL